MTAPPNLIPGIIPAIWQVDSWTVEQVEVIINWLEIEIEKHAELRLPVLAQIRGHRNREVHEYIKENLGNYQEIARLALYGNMPDYQERGDGR
jgi:hypothetical protein